MHLIVYRLASSVYILIMLNGTDKTNTENKMYSIIITWDNTDPYVYGPYATEDEAKDALQKIEDKWDDWDWRHQTGRNIQKMEK